MEIFRKSACALFVVTAVIIGWSIPGALASEENHSAWIGKATKLDEVRALAPTEPIPYSNNGNRDCHYRILQTTTNEAVAALERERGQSPNDCVVDTAYGSVANLGLTQRQGTNAYGELLHSSGGSVITLPIPGSDMLAYFSGSAVKGSYLHFVQDASTKIKSSVTSQGRPKHILQATGDMLRDYSGAPVPIFYDSIAFSANGKWMIADSPNLAMIRVDLETLQILPFAPSYNHNVGLATSQQNAISNDGRYVVSSSPTFSRFSMYDLQTCAPIPMKVTRPVACGLHDLLPYLRQNISDFFGGSRVRFIGQDAFEFYGISRQGSTVTKKALYVMYTGGKPFGDMQYLALGDSFASGEGARLYKTNSDTASNKCHLSLQSYPYIIANILNLTKRESVACSGAKIDDLSSDVEKYLGQNADKIIQTERENSDQILGAFSPGSLTQLTFVEQFKPGTITVSAVGNDIGFSKIILRCGSPDTCYATYEERKELLQHINSQFDRLVKLYADLNSANDPRMKVYVVGYPEIVKSGGNCGNNVHLNGGETYFANELTAYLNDVIKRAARKAGVTYVDVSQSLYGARLCEAPDYEVAVNGLTAGNDLPRFVDGPFGQESYHPNHIGHQLMAQTILGKTDNLGKEFVDESVPAEPPKIADSLGILQAAKANRPIRKLHQLPYTVPITQSHKVKVSAPTNRLKPSSSVQAWLHSDPQHLGSLAADENGNLDVELLIPEGTPAGYHTIHLYGVDVVDTPIDIQQDVFVMHSEGDIDGDGVLNESDPCPVVTPSEQDVDVDGVDDACDGFIDEPPAPQPEPEAPETPEEPEPTNPQPVEIPDIIIEPEPPVIQGPGADKNFLTESDPLASYREQEVAVIEPITEATSTTKTIVTNSTDEVAEPITTEEVLANQSATLAQTSPIRELPPPEDHPREQDRSPMPYIVAAGFLITSLLVIFYVARLRRD